MNTLRDVVDEYIQSTNFIQDYIDTNEGALNVKYMSCNLRIIHYLAISYHTNMNKALNYIHISKLHISRD